MRSLFIKKKREGIIIKEKKEEKSEATVQVDDKGTQTQEETEKFNGFINVLVDLIRKYANKQLKK